MTRKKSPCCAKTPWVWIKTDRLRVTIWYVGECYCPSVSYLWVWGDFKIDGVWVFLEIIGWSDGQTSAWRRRNVFLIAQQSDCVKSAFLETLWISNFVFFETSAQFALVSTGTVLLVKTGPRHPKFNFFSDISKNDKQASNSLRHYIVTKWPPVFRQFAVLQAVHGPLHYT